MNNDFINEGDEVLVALCSGQWAKGIAESSGDKMVVNIL